MVDFTLKAYSELLDGVQNLGYEVTTVRDWIRQDMGAAPSGGLRLILRHDAEWDPRRALDKAEIEAAKGIRGTYYFRAETNVYHISTMHEIQDMGHEIGYHFNVLDRCKGDFVAAEALFKADLTRFRQDGFVVDTVCFHGDPRVPKHGYRVNNDLLLRNPALAASCGLLGEATEDVKACKLTRVSDVGVRWDMGSSTKELVGIFEAKKPPTVYLLTHPDYWSRSAFRAFGLCAVSKTMRVTKINARISGAKKLLRIASRTGRNP